MTICHVVALQTPRHSRVAEQAARGGSKVARNAFVAPILVTACTHTPKDALTILTTAVAHSKPSLAHLALARTRTTATVGNVVTATDVHVESAYLAGTESVQKIARSACQAIVWIVTSHAVCHQLTAEFASPVVGTVDVGLGAGGALGSVGAVQTVRHYHLATHTLYPVGSVPVLARKTLTKRTLQTVHCTQLAHPRPVVVPQSTLSASQHVGATHAVSHTGRTPR